MASSDNDYSNSGISAEMAEKLKEFYPELVFSYDEFLEHQECLYQSMKEFDRNKDTSVPTSDWSRLSGHVSESSQLGNSNSQIVLDEAFARLLLEEDFDQLNISQPSISETETRARSSRESSVMQLQSSRESVGTSSGGLSQRLISKLPRSTYRTGWFSMKKKEKEPPQCVICCMPFKNGDKLITLRCPHQYHSKCIKKWLQLKKRCPICQREVF